MTKTKKVFLSLFVCLISAFLSFPVSAYYLYDKRGNSVPSPEVYVCTSVYDGYSLAVGTLKNPQDICRDNENNLYIADTGNNRIVILNNKLELIRIIDEINVDGTKEKLLEPYGVFVSDDGIIYICDTGNGRVVGLDGNSTALRMYKGENMVAVNEELSFTPHKVAVDRYGNMYIVDTSVYQGIIQVDENDDFTRFFAPNEVEVSVEVVISQLWKRFMTSEQVDAMERTLPSAYSNLYLDTDGFIYTSAYNTTVGQEIKRLNNLGTNILQTEEKSSKGSVFGDMETVFENYKEITTRFIDVNVGTDGIICAADEVQGRLFLYSRDCDLIGVFGGPGEKSGCFKRLSAVEKINDKYIALDSEKGSLTVFEATDYMKNVITALSYYDVGKYTESVDLWKGILNSNSNFSLAYKSIGRAYFQNGDNYKAMKMLEQGNDKYFYSMAFKDYRKEFARKYFVPLLLGSVAVFVLLIFLIKKTRRWILNEKKNSRGGVKLND